MRSYHFIFPLAGIIFLAGCFITKKKTKPADKSFVNEAYVPPDDGIARKYTAVLNHDTSWINISDGIRYHIKAKGNGPAIQKWDKVTMRYVGRLMNDTVFDATYHHNNQPLSFHLCKHEVIAGWDSVVLRLHGGDVAEMYLPSKYGYGSRINGKIPPNSNLKFQVEVISVQPHSVPWNATGKDTIKTPSGLKIIFLDSHPDGKMAKNGNKVTVHYDGFLIDGYPFDSSVERDQPFTFTLGTDPVIKGWAEGIMMMHEGDKAQLIIPFSLGYGEMGYPGVIPPRSTLIFDVQLLEVK
ncbi:MAG: FKBP-type peptidyl-prolyl cis-trans isomerase [Bacteroidetes bacterium]|nr:FKBP-type peptidyl-prolyl cis-trans isomerase [Bacteroidota bacterium]